MNQTYRPEYCVFELTLKCNARCIHCGSSAGKERASELSTEEIFSLINELESLGCRVFTVSGGEPLCHPDWHIIAKEAVNAGFQTELITNGLDVTNQLDLISNTGFFAVGLSIDGPASVHDHLRGVPGGLDELLKGARALKENGVRLSAITQLNRLNIAFLDEILEIIEEARFDGWQVQLTNPVGRAKKRVESLALEPSHLALLEQKLLELRKKTKLFFQAADNIGYMGKGESRLRGGFKGRGAFFIGCVAGTRAIGITSDGTVRGCLSMSPHFDEDNVRNRPLKEIWSGPDSFSYNRRFSVEDLSGACKSCSLAKMCRAGCRGQAWAVTQNPFDNPMCVRAAYNE